MKTHAIGIDFGGTNTKLGVVSHSGRVMAESSFSTTQFSTPPAFAQKAGSEIEALLKRTGVSRNKVSGVGIGVPGLVDHARGIVHVLVNVPGWNGARAGALFERHWKLPVTLENDVNAMALGEHAYGIAKGYQNVVCTTLGTGVGGGLILGGKLYHGATLTAGEIGHIVVEPQGPLCNCGNRGCLEALVGTQGLLDRARVALRKKSGGVLHGWLKQGEVLTPHLLAKAALQGDRTALQVWNETAEYLGIVFAGIANFLNPDVIVVGGGISAAGDFFLGRIRKVIKARAMAVPAKKLKLLRSRLGNRAGVLGAASLNWKNF